jgi:hypothetical protein
LRRPDVARLNDNVAVTAKNGAIRATVTVIANVSVSVVIVTASVIVVIEASLAAPVVGWTLLISLMPQASTVLDVCYDSFNVGLPTTNMDSLSS